MIPRSRIYHLASYTRQIFRRNLTYLCGDGVYRSSGAISEQPFRTRFGAAKIVAVIAPFLLSGAYISKSGAKFLEDNEIFVPEDD